MPRGSKAPNKRDKAEAVIRKAKSAQIKNRTASTSAKKSKTIPGVIEGVVRDFADRKNTENLRQAKENLKKVPERANTRKTDITSEGKVHSTTYTNFGNLVRGLNKK